MDLDIFKSVKIDFKNDTLKVVKMTTISSQCVGCKYDDFEVRIKTDYCQTCEDGSERKAKLECH